MSDMLKREWCAIPLFFLLNVVLAVSAGAGEAVDSDLVIPAGELSGQAGYYPAVIEGYRLTVVAVVAPDKTERVVFNACQACGPAGFGQQRDALVCSACGQSFKLAMLEKQRGGCNPIPVGGNNRSRDGDNIVISHAFLKQVKNYFAQKWPQ